MTTVPERELASLTEKVKKLAELCRQLRQENRKLKAERDRLLVERERYLDRTRAARRQVKNMLEQLQSLGQR